LQLARNRIGTGVIDIKLRVISSVNIGLMVNGKLIECNGVHTAASVLKERHVWQSKTIMLTWADCGTKGSTHCSGRRYRANITPKSIIDNVIFMRALSAASSSATINGSFDELFGSF